jgi:hypothetical protein
MPPTYIHERQELVSASITIYRIFASAIIVKSITVVRCAVLIIGCLIQLCQQLELHAKKCCGQKYKDICVKIMHISACHVTNLQQSHKLRSKNSHSVMWTVLKHWQVGKLKMTYNQYLFSTVYYVGQLTRVPSLQNVLVVIYPAEDVHPITLRSKVQVSKVSSSLCTYAFNSSSVWRTDRQVDRFTATYRPRCAMCNCVITRPQCPSCWTDARLGQTVEPS